MNPPHKFRSYSLHTSHLFWHQPTTDTIFKWPLPTTFSHRVHAYIFSLSTELHAQRSHLTYLITTHQRSSSLYYFLHSVAISSTLYPNTPGSDPALPWWKTTPCVSQINDTLKYDYFITTKTMHFVLIASCCSLNDTTTLCLKLCLFSISFTVTRTTNQSGRNMQQLYKDKTLSIVKQLCYTVIIFSPLLALNLKERVSHPHKILKFKAL